MYRACIYCYILVLVNKIIPPYICMNLNNKPVWLMCWSSTRFGKSKNLQKKNVFHSFSNFCSTLVQIKISNSFPHLFRPKPFAVGSLKGIAFKSPTLCCNTIVICFLSRADYVQFCIRLLWLLMNKVVLT